MFSSMKGYEKNLLYSERFSYDNYDFYNNVENLPEVYKDDLSKFIYNCRRRTKATVLAYKDNNPYLRHAHDRTISFQQLSMEDLLNPFIQTYFENNYMPINRMDDDTQGISLMYVSTLTNSEDQLRDFSINTHFNLEKIIRFMKANHQKNKQDFQTLHQTTDDQLKNMCNFSFEAYCLKVLEIVYGIGQTDIESTLSFNLLYQFTQEVLRLLCQIKQGEMWNVLLLYQPKLPYLSSIIHPLIFPIYAFTQYQLSKDDFFFISMKNQRPRIVFLNLDGKENYHNIQMINKLGVKMLYISVYQQLSWLEKKDIELQKSLADQDANFQYLYNLNSENIIHQFKYKKDSDTQMYLIPLNSHILMKQYQKRKKQRFPKIQSAYDIHFIFQHVIMPQIERYKPSNVFVSYNGQLNIDEDYFTEIIRNLTIISHHKVLLFPNFTSLFASQKILQNSLDPEQDETEQILGINDFFTKFHEYNLQKINKEKLFSNLGSFLKISSGIHSLEDRNIGSLFHKYNMANRYKYIEAMSGFDGFEFMKKYHIKKWKSFDLQKLYKNYGAREIKENYKQNLMYEELIDQVIDELLLKNISESQLSERLEKALFYRRKMIIFQLQGQQESQMENQGSGFQQFLMERKDKLLLQNLENHKYKRVFHLSQQNKKMGHIQCFKISMEKQDNDEIYLEKYSQVIISEHLQAVFLINYYKPNDHRHIMCTMKLGSVDTSAQAYEIQLTEAQLSQQFLKKFHLQEKPQKNIYINYSHCFFKNSLYLYWPQKWNVKEEVRCKLLGLDYKPTNENKVIKIFLQFNQETSSHVYKYEYLSFRPRNEDIRVLPRIGCTSYPLDDRRFIVFGGIYDNEEDFFRIGMAIHYFEVDDEEKGTYFRIITKPKISSNLGVLPCLPKRMNYNLQQNAEKIEDKMDMVIRISGGYGRQFTNSFNLFTYDFFEIDTEKSFPKKTTDHRINRKVVKLNKPLPITKNGKFNVITNTQHIEETDEKFSDGLKDKFLYENKTQQQKHTDEEIITFIDETYKISNFKQDYKKSFLFGYNRTIRQKIYSRFWSPQLYIVDGLKQQIINISLKAEKTNTPNSFIVGNYLMPIQNDIMSLCIEEDIIYILAASPTIDTFEDGYFILYSGSLSNMNEIFKNKQIKLQIKHSFKKKVQNKYLYDLSEKSILVMDEKIRLVGGKSVMNSMGNQRFYERQDYLLEKYKNRLKVKVKKLTSNIDLMLSHPLIVRTNDQWFLYSIFYDENTDEMSNETFSWKIKIQTFTEKGPETQKGIIGKFNTYFFNKKTQRHEICPQNYLNQPKFVKISPYKRFNINIIRELFSKILWRMNKADNKNKMEEQTFIDQLISKIRIYREESNDPKLQEMLKCERQIFIEGIKQLRRKSNDINFQEQELLKDLKHCYSQIVKMILEQKLCFAQTNQPEYRFFVEDKVSKKIKYIAIGPLKTTKLNFFRIRFKHEILLNVNHDYDDGFFFHPIESNYGEIEDEILKGIPFENVTMNEEMYEIMVSFS